MLSIIVFRKKIGIDQENCNRCISSFHEVFNHFFFSDKVELYLQRGFLFLFLPVWLTIICTWQRPQCLAHNEKTPLWRVCVCVAQWLNKTAQCVASFLGLFLFCNEICEHHICGSGHIPFPEGLSVSLCWCGSRLMNMMSHTCRVGYRTRYF